MKKVSKVLFVIFIFITLLILASLSLNCVMESKENGKLSQIGQKVSLKDGDMSIYSEGNGDKTLVFMAGGGTCSPILDFKSLYSTLSDKYKIVVVEKFGYGFSDIIPRSRNIDVILSDTREALDKANIKGPFILVPHS